MRNYYIAHKKYQLNHFLKIFKDPREIKFIPWLDLKI